MFKDNRSSTFNTFLFSFFLKFPTIIYTDFMRGKVKYEKQPRKRWNAQTHKDKLV